MPPERLPALRSRPRPRSCRRAAPLLCSMLLAMAGPALSQSWVNPGVGSWYDAVNWNPAFVPVAGAAVVVSNGGAALLDTVASGGATATPQLSSLTVGQAGTGTGSGGVSSTGVDLLAGFLNVGLASGGTFAEGRVVTTGAALHATGARIGVLFGQPGTASANGVVVVDGNYQAGGNALEIAQMFNAAPGSVAQGRLEAGTVSGSLGGGFWIVGNVTASNATQVGSRAHGEFTAGGGTLALASGGTTFIGTTLGPDRVSDASGTRINEATGLVRLGGTLAVQQNGQSLLVGRTDGGRSEGTLEVGTLAMGANRFGELQVGTSGVLGQARGRLAAGGGDLQHNAGLYVGTSTGGQSQGDMQLGGALRGNGGGTANVGTALGSAGQLVQAQGTVVAAGGFAGYSGISVGTLFGDLAAGSQAIGRLTGGADAGAATTGSVLVGRIGSNGNGNGAVLADGELRSAGSLGMNGGTLEVAQMFLGAAGSSARGVVELGGDVGTVGGGFLIVGNISTSNAGQVGSQSFGEVVAGGGMALASGGTSFIGTTLGTDRVTDASGTRINEASGLVRLGGTLAVQQNGQGLMVGRTGGGRADGELELARIEMGANSFGLFEVGTAIDGDATGRLAVGGGTLRAASLWVGRVFGAGTASGEAVLAGTSLQAGSVVAGTGGGSADVALADSAAAIADDFVLGRGRLSLERSLLAVGDEFSLGADATLALMIENENRGSGYGAIDAVTALLDGELQLDLTSYVFGSGSGVFDLVRAGVAGSIAGDFVSVVFSGLAVGWQAFTGIELVNGQEIYRLRLSTVPEPGSVALVMLALGLMVVAARQRSRRAGRGFTGRS